MHKALKIKTEGPLISYSFGPLRQLQDTFSRLPASGVASRTVEKQAQKLLAGLGETAIPLLARKLGSSSSRESSWAYRLLSRVGGPRVEELARARALDSATDDEDKALALALLTELGAELPERVFLKDPSALRDRSVRELLDSLRGPEDVARAADLLLHQIDPEGLAEFLSDLAGTNDGRVSSLVGELMLRHELSEGQVARLASLRARLPSPARLPTRRRSVTCTLAEHTDGRRAVMVTQRRAGRTRAWVVHLDRNGDIGVIHYEANLAARGEQRIISTLVTSGHALVPLGTDDARHLVARAARLSRTRSGSLPRDYYVGRDLLGLSAEHMTEASADASRPAAAGRLEKVVERHPDDAQARAMLGKRLLDAGKSSEALVHLAVATRLEPENARHHWNLGQAAKLVGKVGAAYSAIRDYLHLRDEAEGGEERHRQARRYVQMFEQFAAKEHPDASVDLVARAEEIFDRAYQHLSDGNVLDAIGGFEAVIKLVPSHYPSWGNLGAAFLRSSRLDEAEHCLRKALEFRPDYDLALKNLDALEDGWGSAS